MSAQTYSEKVPEESLFEKQLYIQEALTFIFRHLQGGQIKFQEA